MLPTTDRLAGCAVAGAAGVPVDTQTVGTDGQHPKNTQQEHADTHFVRVVVSDCDDGGGGGGGTGARATTKPGALYNPVLAHRSVAEILVIVRLILALLEVALYAFLLVTMPGASADRADTNTVPPPSDACMTRITAGTKRLVWAHTIIEVFVGCALLSRVVQLDRALAAMDVQAQYTQRMRFFSIWRLLFLYGLLWSALSPVLAYFVSTGAECPCDSLDGLAYTTRWCAPLGAQADMAVLTGAAAADAPPPPHTVGSGGAHLPSSGKETVESLLETWAYFALGIPTVAVLFNLMWGFVVLIVRKIVVGSFLCGFSRAGKTKD